MARSGTRSVLLVIQRPERSRSESREIVIRQIIRHGNTFDDGSSKLLTLLFRELLELAKNLGGCLCHVLNKIRAWATRHSASRRMSRSSSTVVGSITDGRQDNSSL